MAILENGTQHYFKVDLEHSFNQNNMVFASIIVYASEADRQNEKRRHNEFTAFDANCKRTLQELSADERYEELYFNFSEAVRSIEDRRYTNVVATLSDTTFPQDVARLLMECGYQSEWLSQPICIISKRLINCGLGGAKPLTAEYIYSKLKAKMSPDILDI